MSGIKDAMNATMNQLKKKLLIKNDCNDSIPNPIPNMKIQIDAVRYLILIEFFFLLISFVLGVLLNMVFLLSHALIIPSIKNGCDAKVKNLKSLPQKIYHIFLIY